MVKYARCIMDFTHGLRFNIDTKVEDVFDWCKCTTYDVTVTPFLELDKDEMPDYTGYEDESLVRCKVEFSYEGHLNEEEIETRIAHTLSMLGYELVAIYFKKKKK